MKQAKTLNDLQFILKNQPNLQHEVHGKKYKLEWVSFMMKRMVDIIEMINDGVLYYDNEQ